MTGGAPQTSFGQHITGGNMPNTSFGQPFSQQATSNPFPQMANQFTQQQQYQQQQPVMNQFQQQPQQQQQPFYNQFQLQPNLNQMTNMFQNTSISLLLRSINKFQPQLLANNLNLKDLDHNHYSHNQLVWALEMHHCNHNLREES